MKKVKEIAFDIIAIILIFLFVGWLFNSIKTDQEDFLKKCQDKGYSYTYCMRKMRP